MSTYFRTLLRRQIARINFDGAIWGFPIVVGTAWVLFPALDYEWKVSMGLAPDPEATINYVQRLKDQRKEAFYAAAGKMKKKEANEEEEEEEEEGGDDEEEEEEGGDEAEEGGGEDEDGEGGDDDEEDDEEEDEDDGEPKKLDIPSLYEPVKGEHIAVTDVWDNFTLKALNMSDDDDEDEEDE